MDWSALSFLAEPWFVIPWYAVGILGAGYVLFDLYTINTPLKKAMKWAWPIIVLFFSVLGLALYLAAARASGVNLIRSEQEKDEAHHAYQRSMVRRVNGAVIHCVAGDGLGIMSAMVIARAVNMTFWQEFWFEYAVGFCFGWLIFQFKSMTMMTDSKLMALAMAFRSEFFSMLTVMGGMGAVMTYVTPAVVGAQPHPLTYAFWGFGMLGLLVGYVFTFPMNWMLVNVGWKHGMGEAKGAQTVHAKGGRYGLFSTMVALGIATLALPAGLTEVREGRPIRDGTARAETGAETKLAMLARGLDQDIRSVVDYLKANRRREAMDSLDAAMRAAEVGAETASNSGFRAVLDTIKAARHSLQMGDEHGAQQRLAATPVPRLESSGIWPLRRPQAYEGVPVLNVQGAMIGKIKRVEGDRLQLALGGILDVWGFWDLTSPAGDMGIRDGTAVRTPAYRRKILCDATHPRWTEE